MFVAVEVSVVVLAAGTAPEGAATAVTAVGATGSAVTAGFTMQSYCIL